VNQQNGKALLNFTMYISQHQCMVIMTR